MPPVEGVSIGKVSCDGLLTSSIAGRWSSGPGVASLASPAAVASAVEVTGLVWVEHDVFDGVLGGSCLGKTGSVGALWIFLILV
jgi:hypothetical protein